MILSALFALSTCLAVGPASDHIVARDLDPALPGLADAGGETPVSLAPAPGVPRLFGFAELRRLGARFQLAGEPVREICFERPVSPPDPARLLAAMRRQLPEARIEILDYSRAPAPEGDLDFPLAGVRCGTSDQLWSGSVRYAASRRFYVWARVRVVVRASRVVAAQDLHPGPAIAAEQLRVETREELLSAGGYAGSLESVAGRAARLPIRAGAAIRLDWLTAPQDVVRGDRVVVEVYNGGAYLRFEAAAEASGTVGAVIPVTNPVSKKRFPARVEGKDRVSVGKGSL